ncbi:16S rRNA (guanine966-N2)-methyltransferase [Williamsia muralis]|uniref:16S rRNA (Guanine966-N2)-methyltransferase n=1 Tax=Williamsia marianensis TaxID=85044 RepID=A0A495K654_WILMA|nr:16S rRNA (guanine(966)-N(2))-methyltransferase RsmD [Williamsia muralis]RKR95882.1 16S rRNA (guanine966-N2)-methyltransferase [Williamsia muralis]
MTRIIAGSARGRRLSVPAAGTRPTTDRVRESMFNILAARIDFTGLIVLDLFAGSGALGLEALSRGAESVTFVEADAKAVKTIEANIRASGLSGGRVIRRRAAEHLERSGGAYDLVLADPPYDLPEDEVAHLVRQLADGAVSDGGLVVLERAARAADTWWPSEFDDVLIRRYGETRVEVALYRPPHG